MRILIIVLALAACGLPPDIVGPTDTDGLSNVPPENCPNPDPVSGVRDVLC